MKLPKTTKGFLRLLIKVASHDPVDCEDEEERKFISYIQADILNHIGEDEFGIIEKYKLK